MRKENNQKSLIHEDQKWKNEKKTAATQSSYLALKTGLELETEEQSV